jgi:hypothetical protein
VAVVACVEFAAPTIRVDAAAAPSSNAERRPIRFARWFGRLPITMVFSLVTALPPLP